MEDKNERILKDMEETRTSLTEKVEAIEHLVAQKVQAGADVVQYATDTARDIVSDVKETVHGVTEKVGDVVDGVKETVGQAVESVASVFDLRKQTERHPWVVLGVSAMTGCMLGSYLARRSHRRPAAADVHRVRARQARGGNGAAHPVASTRSKESNGAGSSPREHWFRDHLRHLQGIAISTLFGAVRDMVRKAVPGEVGKRLSDEVDCLTEHLGGEPIRGPVLGDETEARGRNEEAEESGRASSTDRGNEPGSATNRLRAHGT